MSLSLSLLTHEKLSLAIPVFCIILGGLVLVLEQWESNVDQQDFRAAVTSQRLMSVYLPPTVLGFTLVVDRLWSTVENCRLVDMLLIKATCSPGDVTSGHLQGGTRCCFVYLRTKFKGSWPVICLVWMPRLVPDWVQEPARSPVGVNARFDPFTLDRWLWANP